MRFQPKHALCIIGSLGIAWLVISALMDILHPSGESLFNEYLILGLAIVGGIIWGIRKFISPHK